MRRDLVGNSMRPHDLPSAQVLAENKPHGVRLRYLAGCHCMLCRAANSRYQTGRAQAIKNGDWNGLVPAARARRHLLRLSRAGVGRDAVEAACGVHATLVSEITSGRKTQMRALTERKILSVDKTAVAAGSNIDAGPTWKLINRLLQEGFTRGELASRLGYKTRALQFRKDRILARNAARVERFYRRIMAGG